MSAENDRGWTIVLTGAGVSAESGLGTFRDLDDGLWAQYDLTEVATPEGFARDPAKVLDFYSQRRRNLRGAKPNTAHFALADLETQLTERDAGPFLLVTQNIDRLHERAGSRGVLHMHGELMKTRCQHCGWLGEDEKDLSPAAVCGQCGKDGGLRPDVVWFGEMPYHMDRIEAALSDCTLFIAVGTSGSVYPANSFVSLARAAGAHTVELNLEPSEGDYLFSEHHYGPATSVVPDYVHALLLDTPPSR